MSYLSMVRKRGCEAQLTCLSNANETPCNKTESKVTLCNEGCHYLRFTFGYLLRAHCNGGVPAAISEVRLLCNCLVWMGVQRHTHEGGQD
jgi:hypothetical protein